MFLKYFSLSNNIIVYLNLAAFVSGQTGITVQNEYGNKAYEDYVYNGYQYAAVALPYSWKTARIYCQNKSAELVSVHSQAEWNFLKNLLSGKESSFGKQIWIGLYRSGSDFIWSDDTVLDFNILRYHQDPSDPKYSCVHMKITSDYWSKDICYEEMGFVCKRKIGSSSEPMAIPMARSTSGNCRRGWRPFKDSCYLPVGLTTAKDRADFKTAQKRCSQLNGSLVVIEDEDEQVFLTFLSQSFNEDTWIGLYYTMNPGIYRWVRNKIVSYTNWEHFTSLQRKYKEDCVYMTYGYLGEWMTSNCDDKLPFICESSKDPAVLEPSTSPLPSKCHLSQVWLKQNNSCFKFFNENKSYAGAIATCELYGAKLISITDYKVQALFRYLTLENKTSTWIGLLKNSNQEYEWINGFQMTMSNWINGMPVTRNELDLCFVGTPSGFWNISNCQELRPFICQINLGKQNLPDADKIKGCAVNGFTSVDETDDYCYAIVDRSLDAYGASVTCMSKGGKLLSIHSKAQVENLKKYLNETGFNNFPLFIGLSKSREGRMSWWDGSPVNFEYWDDAPLPYDYTCTQIKTETLKWNVVNCYSKAKAICSVRKEIYSRTAIEKSLQRCNSAWSEHASNSSYFHDGYCYELITLWLDWEMARKYCQNRGAELASVHSKSEVDFLIKLLYARNSGKTVWIGLRSWVDESRGFSKQFKWSDGTLIDFVNWNAPQPIRLDLFEHCCSMNSKNGSWSHDYCSHGSNFICKWKNDSSSEPIITTSSSSTPLSGHCKTGWHTFRYSCYLPVGVREKDWCDFATAREKCASLNGSLVIIDDEDEQAFLEFLLQNIKKDTWIGLHDDIKSGVYFWVGNKPLNFTNWDFGVPSPFEPQEDCIHMIYGTWRSGFWKDTNCSVKLPFICESSKDPAITVPWTPLSSRCIYPQGWLKQSYSCFKLFREKKSWLEAANTCERYGAKLISISDYIVQAAFKYLTFENKTSSWIGLLKSPNQELEWVNGFPMTMSSWEKNMPVTRNETYLCFISSSRGLWSISDCQTPHPFVCQINSGKMPSVEGEIKSCTVEGFESVDDKDIYCYKIFENKNFHNSRYDCLLKGGNLLSVHSKAQVESLKNYLKGKQFPNLPFYIGLQQYESYKDGFWWTDFSPINFEYWEDGELVYAPYQCGIMKTETLKWAVVDCNHELKQNSICSVKKELALPVNKQGASAFNQFLPAEKEDPSKNESQNSSSSGVIAAILVPLMIMIIASTLAYIHFKRQPITCFRFRVTNPETAHYNVNSDKDGEFASSVQLLDEEKRSTCETINQDNVA